MKKVLIICGPTATGKTKLAAYLARQFRGELVSADSRQVYRGMNVTTGKERVDVPIWLYDVVDPDEEFSVSHWVKLAKAAIFDIQKRNKLPIIVGGTGLYFQALLRPFETIDIPPDKKLRQQLQKLPVSTLQKMLPRNTINDSDWNNPRRLIRRIEIANYNREPVTRPPWDVLQIGLTAPLAVLDARIDERLKERKSAGLDEEAATLWKKYRADLPAMSALNVNEHAYARRQMTWFKKQEDVRWFDVPCDFRAVEKLVFTWYTR